MDWHSQSVQEIERELNTGLQGLTQNEAVARLEQYGENKLRSGKKKTNLQRFLNQFFGRVVVFGRHVCIGQIAAAVAADQNFACRLGFFFQHQGFASGAGTLQRAYQPAGSGTDDNYVVKRGVHGLQCSKKNLRLS